MKHLFVLFSITIFFSTSHVLAQKSKKNKNEEIIIDSGEGEYPIKTHNKKSYNSEKKYYTIKINSDYNWFYYENSSSKIGKYGIINNNEEVILSNIFYYESTGDDYNKILTIDNKYGLFNLKEERWAIPMENDYIKSFNSNFLAVKKRHKYSLVDFNNKPIIDKEWHDVISLSSSKNYVKVSERRKGTNYYGLFSLLEKKLVIPCNYLVIDELNSNSNIFLVKNANTFKYNLIDINNKLRFNNWYDEIKAPNYIGNRFIIKEGDNYGVIDSHEKIIVPLNYMLISLASYSNNSHLSRNKEGKYGFMTIEGNTTLPFEYDELNQKSSSNNMISIKDYKYGIVTVNSGLPKEIIACDYEDITHFKEILIVKKNSKYGLVDNKGKIITETIYEDLEILNQSRNKNFIKVKIKNKYLILNELGQPITNEAFKEVDIIVDKSKNSFFNYDYFTFFKVKKKNQFQIMDAKGEIVSTNTFDDITSEYKKVLIIKKNDKSAFFNLLNNKILDYSYDLITRTKNYYLGVRGNKIDILIYKEGDIVLSHKD